jgi:hypothetical protein
MLHIRAPRAPIRCHAVSTLRASQRHMAQHDNLLVNRWNWMIKSFVKKIHWEVSLFYEKIFFNTYFCIFHCILPVPTPQYTIILLLLPNIMLRCCWYTCTEHLTSRYVWKIYWVFLVYWISAIFLPIFGIFQCIPPIFTLLYTVELMLHTFSYHSEHVFTL